MHWEFRADQPIYTQLMRQMQEAIVSGQLQAGERLPSVRELAMDAGVNPNTVQRALTDLEQAGLVFSQRTLGRFVTEDCERIAQARRSLAQERSATFWADMKKLGCSAEEIFALLRQQKEEFPCLS